MSDSLLWARDLHTAAKHQMLRSYLDGWVPVMAQHALRAHAPGRPKPRLLLVDGFAGPGRYLDGEPGSPLIMLDAVRSHSAFRSFSAVEFSFLFIEHHAARAHRLREEIDALQPLPSNFDVQVEHGEYETTFGLIERTREQDRVLVPTFAFLDPFGYSHVSMSLTGQLLNFPRSELLTFLPLTHAARFIGRSGQEAAMTSLFGCDDWRDALSLEGEARKAFLLHLFERQVEANDHVRYVRSFQLRTQDGNDYRLVFGLSHEKGLELAKDAMWNVDPYEGTCFTASTTSGQEVLFSPDHVLDTQPLLSELRNQFGADWFSIEDAERCTLVDTPFKKAHLRSKTLQPAEEYKAIDVRRTGQRGYPAGTQIRFLD